MAWPTSNFPTSLDSITDKVDNTDTIIAADINGTYDCIEKLEAKVGVNSSAVATSLDYKVTALQNSYVNKNLFNAQTILVATTDDNPVALTVGLQNIVGRITGGNIASLTAAQVKTLLAILDSDLTLSDITTNNVSTSKHGFVPKAPNDSAQALLGNGAWGSPVPAASISQSKLKTSTGSVSVLVHHESGAITAALPGGEYGFIPQAKASDAGYIYFYGFWSASTLSTTYTTPGAHFYNGSLDSNYTGYAQQRYVTSSGEVFWIFILRDKTTKEIISVFQAPDHPCFGNGGNPLLMPHPFGSYDPLIHDIVVINPSDDEVNTMRNACITPENKSDRDMIEVILEDYEIDENSNPDWPTTPVTVGLDNSQDWKRAQDGTPVTPIKKVIEKPVGILVKSLRKKTNDFTIS